MDKTIKDILDNCDAVTNYSLWERGKMSRTYIDLRGYDKTWRGCRTTKVYVDNHTGQLVVDDGKGLAPEQFDASVVMLKAAFNQ